MMRVAFTTLLLLGLSPWSAASAACTLADMVGAAPVELPEGTVIAEPREFSLRVIPRADGSFDAIMPLRSSLNRTLDRAAAKSIEQASLPASCLKEPGEQLLVIFSALPAQPGQSDGGSVQIVRIDPAAPKTKKP